MSAHLVYSNQYTSLRILAKGIALLVISWTVTISMFGCAFPGSITTPAPTPTRTSVSQKWHPLLRLPVPNCNNPSGVVWYVHTGGTSLSCSASGLIMRQKSKYYAEVDLVQVNGSTYNQTTFRVQVQASFQSPHNTETSAALLVQTPAAVNAVGGYIFVLNPTGQWQLQNVITAVNIPVVANGSVNLKANQPVILLVEVQNSVLRGFINNQQVVSITDTLNPSPGQVGLLIEGQATEATSAVQFSNFELDTLS